MLGRPPIRRSSQTGQETLASELPLPLIQHLRTFPYPASISGTSNVIFTLTSSTSRPIRLWNGDDFIELRWNVAYTWTATGNNTLSSAGVVTSSGTSSSAAVGVHYMYLNAAGTTLYSSQTAPAFKEDDYGCGLLGHPGTSATQNYVYVGFMSSTATTPTFEAMTKVGYTWTLAATTKATATTWAELDFSAFVPKHLTQHGGSVGGYLTTGNKGSVRVGNNATNTIGAQLASITTSAPTSVAGLIMSTPFGPIVPTANGKIYAQHVTAAGTVALTFINDVV